MDTNNGERLFLLQLPSEVDFNTAQARGGSRSGNSTGIVRSSLFFPLYTVLSNRPYSIYNTVLYSVMYCILLCHSTVVQYIWIMVPNMIYRYKVYLVEYGRDLHSTDNFYTHYVCPLLPLCERPHSLRTRSSKHQRRRQQRQQAP